MNRYEVEREIRTLGGVVEPVRRKGENRYTHPLMVKPMVVNARRKDSTKFAEHWLSKLRRAVSGAGAGA